MDTTPTSLNKHREDHGSETHLMNVRSTDSHTCVYVKKQAVSVIHLFGALCPHAYPQTQIQVLVIIWKRNAKFSRWITDLLSQKDLETILTHLDASMDRGC